MRTTKNGSKGRARYFKSRAERVKADIARRKAGRKAIKGEDVKDGNGKRRMACGWDRWLVSGVRLSKNRIIEVDLTIYRRIHIR